MDIGKSFSYVFEDTNWIVKVAIGGGILLVGALFSFLLLIPLLAALALTLGYTLMVTKNVADGSAAPLPEWNDIGTLFVKGLTGLVGAVIWFLPVIVIACCIGLVNVGVGAAANGSSSSASSGAAGLLTLVSFCLSCILFVLSLLFAITVYAPLTRFATSGQLNVFWDYAGNWRFIQTNAGSYIVAALVILVLSLVANALSICLIGFFMTFWVNLVGAHLFGQMARGAPAPSMMAPQPTAIA